ncbi:unnamed protein product [Adineta steineri]|uniref:Uncharacterized protein n=1 Tax=Adineta steineri TaxID=433720 RepID=A0A813XEB7_9BILA|nr:unnamed protein product [Adineta steineri]CAF3593011.1 unnamed protein product [Adineta steineri]
MLIFYNYDDYIYRDLYDDIYEITYVKDTSRRCYTICDDPITYVRDTSRRYYTVYDEPITYIRDSSPRYYTIYDEPVTYVSYEYKPVTYLQTTYDICI